MAEPLELVERVLARAGEGHELIVSWAPGRSMPMSIFLLRVNGHMVAHDELDTDSPFIATKLPDPDKGQFTVDWSLKPEVPVQILIVSLRNRTTGKQVILDSKENPDAGDPWTVLDKVSDAP